MRTPVESSFDVLQRILDPFHQSHHLLKVLIAVLDSIFVPLFNKCCQVVVLLSHVAELRKGIKRPSDDPRDGRAYREKRMNVAQKVWRTCDRASWGHVVISFLWFAHKVPPPSFRLGVKRLPKTFPVGKVRPDIQ